MNIDQLLNILHCYDIQIFSDNRDLKIKYEQSSEKNIEEIKKHIKNNKKELKKRLEENKRAIEKDFLIFSDGELYEYRYGLNSYLFIERLENGLTQAYRANFRRSEVKPYKIVVLTNNVDFDTSFKKAMGFIDWINKRRKY